MTEYNKISDVTFTSTGVAKYIKLPYLPDSVEMWNKTASALNTNHLVASAIGWAAENSGVAYTQTSNGTANTNVKITAGGFSFVTAGTYQYGPTLTISGIVAATGVVTTTTPHNLAVGDAVQIYGTTGMLQIAGTATTVTAVPSTTTFTLGNIPTAGFAANATAGFAKKILYPDLYKPYGTIVTGVTAANPCVITTSLNHSFVVGQEVFFVMPQTAFTGVWGMGGLDSAAVVNATGIPQQAYVTAITSNTITINIDSSGFAAFTYPTSAQAALGITFPQVFAIGDQNSGQSSVVQPLTPPITIPGAFYANTSQGVIVGIGDGTTLMHQTGDVIKLRFIYPDQIFTA
jgi:hypothetical protein